MFFHLNVAILTARDAGRLQANSSQKRKQALARFQPKTPVDCNCIQGAGPNE